MNTLKRYSLLFSFFVCIATQSFAADSAFENSFDSADSPLPKCIVEDCKGGTWQNEAIHWRIRKDDDNVILEYGPGPSWNEDTRRNATLKNCNRYYLGQVCGKCEIRALPAKLKECKEE
ncbi:MAG: hypothetical protein JNL01_03810 [Bdellovibrionales bacterium]|nr:hypothetical protein [Bdellovibrionales bacterium]